MITSRAKFTQIDEGLNFVVPNRRAAKELFEADHGSLLLHLVEKARDELQTKVRNERSN